MFRCGNCIWQRWACFLSRTVYYHCWKCRKRERANEMKKKTNAKNTTKQAAVILHIYHNCRCQITYQTMLKYRVISVSLSICYKFLLHTNFCLLRFVNLAIRRAICYAEALLSNSKEHGDQPRIIIIQFVNNLIIIFTISIVHEAHSKALHAHTPNQTCKHTNNSNDMAHASQLPAMCNRRTLPFFALFCIAFCSHYNCFNIQKFKYRTNGVSAYRLMSVDELTMCVCMYSVSSSQIMPLNH